MEEISFADFMKLDIRVGKILKAEDIEGADKLYKLTVDIGEERTLAAGIKKHYPKEELEGKKCIILANLEPKTLRGVESKGMILAAGEEDNIVLIEPEKEIEVGSKIH